MRDILIGIGIIILVIICEHFVYKLFKKIDGVLVINTDDPKKDVFRFELDDLNHLDKKDFLWIKVKKESSHENRTS